MATKATTTKKKAPVRTASKTSVKTVPASAKKTSLGTQIVASLSSLGWWRTFGAEFIGTFLLASIFIVGQGQPIFVLFGLVGIVLLIGAVSGAHVNPAITVGAWVTRRIGWLRAVGYIFAQFLGAAVAYVTLQAFLGGQAPVSSSAAAYGQTAQELFKAVSLSTIPGKEWYVFFSELLGTAILGFAVANAFRAKEQIGSAFSVGLGIFVALMVAGTAAGYVGATVIINPAVALSLQVFGSDAWAYVIYALAPVIGGVIGFIIYALLRPKTANSYLLHYI